MFTWSSRRYAFITSIPTRVCVALWLFKVLTATAKRFLILIMQGNEPRVWV